MFGVKVRKYRFQMREWHIPFCFFIVSFVLRSIVVFLYRDIPLISDETVYHHLGMSIHNGDGFAIHGRPTSFNPPLFALFLSGFFKLFGNTVLPVKLAQALMASFLCFPLYFLSKDLFSKKVGILTVGFYSVYLSLVYMSNKVLTETLFVFLFVYFIYFFIKGKTRFTIGLSGLFWGLATLARPILLYFPLLLLPYIYYTRTPRKLLAVLVFFLTLLPWAIRNTMVHDEFVLLTTYQGYVLYNSSHPVDGKKFGFMTPEDDVIRESKTLVSEVERSRFLMKKGIQSILADPFGYLKLGVLKVLFFWVPYDWEIISKQGKPMFNFTYTFLFPFFLFGAFVILRRSENEAYFSHVFILSLFLYFCFFCVLSYGSPRFRLPLEPFLIMFGAYGVTKFIDRFGFRRSFAVMLLYLGFNIEVYFRGEVYKKSLAHLLSSMGIW